MKSISRAFWYLLAAGLILRCVALDHPLVDSHLLRQTQTAAVTKSLIEDPGFQISSRIPWAGDLDARFVLELPLYNYLIIPVYYCIGDLDRSGKLVSILLWGASFLLLQFIWKRCLTPAQTLWANALFVLAPMEVFYGQTFMPEMLVQTLAFGFVLLILRYEENPVFLRWTACVAVGLVALLVKLPETAHLYLVLAFLVLRRERWKALLRPHYWVAAVCTAVAVQLWAHYMDSVNGAHLSTWTSNEHVRGFIGSFGSRLDFRTWVMAGLYLGSFAVPALAAIPAAGGLWIVLRKKPNRALGLWLLSLAVFYLLWFGNGAAKQNYYNLPALAPLCALFGVGLSDFLNRKPCLEWPRVAWTGAALLLIASSLPGTLYLFKQDRQILEAALWTRTHTAPEDLILFRPGHRWDMVDYCYNAVFPYYAARPSFIWTRNTPEAYRQDALERARYAIVTLPKPAASGWLGSFHRFRGVDKLQVESMDWLESRGFTVVARETGFTVYRRN